MGARLRATLEKTAVRDHRCDKSATPAPRISADMAEKGNLAPLRTFKKRRMIIAALLLTILLGMLPAYAQLSQNMQDWMRRINSGEFSRRRSVAGGRQRLRNRREAAEASPASVGLSQGAARRLRRPAAHAHGETDTAGLAHVFRRRLVRMGGTPWPWTRAGLERCLRQRCDRRPGSLRGKKAGLDSAYSPARPLAISLDNAVVW